MNEFFSNSSGSIQFIEFTLDLSSENETQTDGATLESNTVFHTFGQDLVGSTAFKKFLAATQGFVGLPGAPTPDFIIPDNFFDPSSDLLRYLTIAHVVQLNGVPTDGLHSADLVGNAQINSPTNFAGESGTINLAAAVPAVPGWLLVTCAGLLVAIAGAFVSPRLQSSA